MSEETEMTPAAAPLVEALDVASVRCLARAEARLTAARERAEQIETEARAIDAEASRVLDDARARLTAARAFAPPVVVTEPPVELEHQELEPSPLASEPEHAPGTFAAAVVEGLDRQELEP